MDASITRARSGSAVALPAVAAWGAGLIQLALGAGALTGSEGAPATFVAGAALLALGAATFAWGSVSLSRGLIVVPRSSIAGAVAGIVTLTAALAIDPTHISVLAVAAASALLVAVGLGIALVLRGRPTRRIGRSHGVLATIIGAVVVAGLVTPALGATEAGRMATDHGGMTMNMDMSGHGH
ncbi:MAG: hypothetical protein KKH75_05135 [Actinobacteria bacterium]|nr:hypothetical protein [Actinomycetota bacterium]